MATPDGAVDLRSDTVTRPTSAMRRAMAAAVVGDDVYGEDPTVNRLQDLAAEVLGMEAAIFVPSGTMANQLAVRTLAPRGTEVLCLPGAHVRAFEAAAVAMNSGVQVHPLSTETGAFPVAAAEEALAAAAFHRPAVSLITTENTYAPRSGRPADVTESVAVTALAARHDVPVHVDGARIFNAAVALGTRPRALVTGSTTAMFCVSKGLGAPIGSLLCGSAAVIAAAREDRQRLGGNLRQAGIVAAAGIVALETGVDRLVEDHERAQRLATALAELFPGSLDPADVRTNIVCAEAGALPDKILFRLADVGILAGALDPHTIRFCTHRDVDDADIDRTISALATLD